MPLGSSIDDQRSDTTIEIASSESGATLKIADSKKNAAELEGCIIRETTVCVSVCADVDVQL